MYHEIRPENGEMPKIEEFRFDSMTLYIGQQDSINVEKLRNLEREQRVNVRLDSINMHNTVWPNELLKQIYSVSNSLSKAVTRAESMGLSLYWMMFWELLAVVDDYGGIPKKDIYSFHVGQNAFDGVYALHCHKLIFTDSKKQSRKGTIVSPTTSPNKHNKAKRPPIHESLYVNGNMRDIKIPGVNAIRGVDGTTKFTSANMRAWHNMTLTKLSKRPNFIISSNINEQDKPSDLIFALLNMENKGTACIHIPRIATASIASIIHLYTRCFRQVVFYSAMALDRVWLIAIGFRANRIQEEHKKILYDYCETYTLATSILNASYMQHDAVSTLLALVDINTGFQEKRYYSYKNILVTYNTIIKSPSAKMFDQYTKLALARLFPDISNIWTKYNKFSRVSKCVSNFAN